MVLTTAQLATFKTDVIAAGGGAEFSTAIANKDWNVIFQAYNANASPDYWAWRTSVSKTEYYNSTSIDGTVFSMVGAGYITRAVGERDGWREVFDINGNANPSLPQTRQAVADIFSGATAPAPANRTHLLTVSRRKALRIEKLFAAGTGSTASPAVMAVEGQISLDDVAKAMS
jgi:hypothetical protein